MTRPAAIALAALFLTACRGDESVRSYGAEGKVWVLTELDGNGFTARATLTFPEPGRIAGDAPCNSYSAAMDAPYPWFAANRVVATKRSCPEQLAEVTFFKALGKATLSEVLGDTLVLSDPGGLEMVFKASE